MIFCVDPERSFVYVYRWCIEYRPCGLMLPSCQCLVETKYEFEQYSFGNHDTNHRFHQLLHSVQRYHLTNHQVDHKSLQTITMLQGAVPVRGKQALCCRSTGRTTLDFSIHMINHFLRYNVDPGASFMVNTRNFAQVFCTDFVGNNL